MRVQTLVACICRSACDVARRRRLPPHLDSPSVCDRPLRNLDRPLRNLDRPLRNLERPLRNLDRPLRNLDKPLRNLDRPLRNLNWPLRNLNWPLRNLDRPLRNLNWPLRNLNWPLRNLTRAAPRSEIIMSCAIPPKNVKIVGSDTDRCCGVYPILCYVLFNPIIPFIEMYLRVVAIPF